MANQFTSKIGLKPIYSTKDPNGNPATLGETAVQIIRDNTMLIEQYLEDKVNQGDYDDTKKEFDKKIEDLDNLLKNHESDVNLHFKPVPDEGIDSLINQSHQGMYLDEKAALGGGVIYVVSYSYTQRVNTQLSIHALSGIHRRYYLLSTNEWSDWELIYATPEQLKEVIADMDKLSEDIQEQLGEINDKKTDVEMFFNVSQRQKNYGFKDFEEARNAVPEKYRALGQVIIYKLESVGWRQEIFIGDSLTEWSMTANWRPLGGGNRVFDGGRPDTIYGGCRVINCGGPDSVFDGDFVMGGTPYEYDE